MASRKATAERRMALVRSLRDTAADGSLPAGSMLPTVRELAEQFGLSLRTVSQELRRLERDGVLTTVPRVGTFVAQPNLESDEVYLLLAPAEDDPYGHAPHIQRVRIGFEEQLAKLGAASITMPADGVGVHVAAGRLPGIAGVFIASNQDEGERNDWLTEDIPRVRFAPPSTADAEEDRIYFDDADGAEKATRHLLDHAHAEIAFLGLHQARGTSELYAWSKRRERGWRQTLTQAGKKGRVFLPPHEPPGWDDEVSVATDAARNLVEWGRASGVVAASDHAVSGLLQALRDATVPERSWPAIVGFDDLPETRSFVLTSIRLPWEEMGREGARLLWERRNDKDVSPPRHRELAMSLIPRLSSKHGWWATPAERA